MKRMAPAANKFHVGNGEDGKHYWLTPPDLYRELDAEFHFDFDPAPYPLPDSFDGLTQDWGQSNYVNPPFGAILHEGKRKGMTAWVRKAIAEQAKGKRVVMVYPIDKWVLMLLKAGATVRNLGDVRWLATEDGSAGNGTGRHIACFVLEPKRDAMEVLREAVAKLSQSSSEKPTTVNQKSTPALSRGSLSEHESSSVRGRHHLVHRSGFLQWCRTGGAK